MVFPNTNQQFRHRKDGPKYTTPLKDDRTLTSKILRRSLHVFASQLDRVVRRRRDRDLGDERLDVGHRIHRGAELTIEVRSCVSSSRLRVFSFGQFLFKKPIGERRGRSLDQL